MLYLLYLRVENLKANHNIDWDTVDTIAVVSALLKVEKLKTNLNGEVFELPY